MLFLVLAGLALAVQGNSMDDTVKFCHANGAPSTWDAAKVQRFVYESGLALLTSREFGKEGLTGKDFLALRRQDYGVASSLGKRLELNEEMVFSLADAIARANQAEEEVKAKRTFMRSLGALFFPFVSTFYWSGMGWEVGLRCRVIGCPLCSSLPDHCAPHTHTHTLPQAGLLLVFWFSGIGTIPAGIYGLWDVYYTFPIRL